MAKKDPHHQTSERPYLNPDGSQYYTKHSYKGVNLPGIRRSHDRYPDGTKANDHITDQSTKETYYVQDSGKHKAGDLTNEKGKTIDKTDRGLLGWLFD
jgi:hypothetical protein